MPWLPTSRQIEVEGIIGPLQGGAPAGWEALAALEPGAARLLVRETRGPELWRPLQLGQAQLEDAGHPTGPLPQAPQAVGACQPKAS